MSFAGFGECEDTNSTPIRVKQISGLNLFFIPPTKLNKLIQYDIPQLSKQTLAMHGCIKKGEKESALLCQKCSDQGMDVCGEVSKIVSYIFLKNDT